MAKIQDFTVYLKDGRNFPIKNVTFEIKEFKLSFSNEYGTISDYVYLALENVAAIIPEQNQAEGQPYLDIYLKESEFRVVAERFEIADKTGKNELKFIWNENRLIYSIYVDLTEVVAINLNDFEAIATKYGFEKSF